MNTPQKLPTDHHEAEDAIVIPENQKLIHQDPAFIELMDDRRKLFRQVDDFEPVTDIHNTAGMSAAKALRQQIVKNRTALTRVMGEVITKLHSAHKAACDMRRPLIEENERAEDHLRDSEEYAIRYEQSRKAELVVERSKLLVPWVTPEQLTTFNLGEMTEDGFAATLAGMKAAREAQVKEALRVAQEEQKQRDADKLAREVAEKALTEERRERAEAEAAIQRTMEKERERMRAERKAKELAFKKQQEEFKKNEAILAEAAAEERRQKEALEQAERDRQAAEQKKKADAEAARKKAERAPDKEKLVRWLYVVYQSLAESPICESPEALKIAVTFTAFVDEKYIAAMKSAEAL